MPEIIKTATTLNAIEAGYGIFGDSWKLGMSGIGNECQRALYYGFHWASFGGPLIPRTQRIFNVGHMFERIAIADLKRIGCFVYKVIDGKQIEMTGELGEKQEVLIGQTGHEKGKPDGRITGLPEAPSIEHTLELKTMKAKYFVPLVKTQSIYKSSYNYYCQVQRYMVAMETKATFFLGINKDTCQYYSEIIPLDLGFAKDLVRKELNIIMSDMPLERGFPVGHYKCNMCKHNLVCEGRIKPLVNCRTCQYSELGNGGKWYCTIKSKPIELSIDAQKAACGKYRNNW